MSEFKENSSVYSYTTALPLILQRHRRLTFILLFKIIITDVTLFVLRPSVLWVMETDFTVKRMALQGLSKLVTNLCLTQNFTESPRNQG